MPKIVLNDMILKYTKVFDKQGQFGDIDRGDPKSEHKWLRELAKNPVSIVDAYFPNDEVMNELMAHPNFDNVIVNPQTGGQSTRIKDGDSETGNGKFIKLKRKWGESITFLNKKKEEETIELEPAVRVSLITKDENGDITSKEEYDYDEEGPISNGTVADILVDIYGKGNTRLEAIGITHLERFEPSEGNNHGF